MSDQSDSTLWQDRFVSACKGLVRSQTAGEAYRDDMLKYRSENFKAQGEISQLQLKNRALKEDLEAERRKTDDLECRIEILKGALFDLIDNSTGVVGLHQNGDVAPWDDLLEGGRFEAWLFEFGLNTAEVEPSEAQNS